MKLLRAGLLATSLGVGTAFILLAGFEMISLVTLALGGALLIVAVTIGLAITGAGQPQRTVASMLYDTKTK